MHGKGKREIVEWKDTNDKPYYVPYQFPIMLTNRCWFFWANTKNKWKTVLNLADKLAFSCHISVVFLYGEIKEQTLKNYLDKLHNQQLVVLHNTCISPEDFECFENAIEYVKGAKSWGGAVKDKNGEYVFDVHPFGIVAEQSGKHLNFLKAKALIQSIAGDIETQGWEVINGDTSIKHVSGKQEQLTTDLLEVVKDIYPYGMEHDTTKEWSYKRAGVPKLIRYGLKCDTESSSVANMGISVPKEHSEMQMSFFNDYSVSAMEIIDLIRTACDSDLKERGQINQRAMEIVLVNRPYGVYECNYYYYILAYAYSKYLNGYYFGGRLTSCPIEQVELDRTNIVAPPLYRMTDKQRSLNKKLIRLFDIQLGQYDNKYDIDSLQWCLSKTRQWITDNIHYDTIQRLSPELFELITMFGDYNDNFNDIYSLETEKYDDYLTEDVVAELYGKLRKVDDDFFARLTKRYGKEVADNYRKHNFVKGGAIGWLWKTEMVDEQVEKFMKDIVCRECGRKLSFGSNENAKTYQTAFTENGKMEIRDWSLKEIIGINKKFLGRYQNQYFCPKCLAESLDCTELELWDKMHSFKESGCTLF